MPIGEPLDSKFPLRMTQAERAIVEDVQASFAAVGVTASLNDVIRHLVRSVEIPRPANAAAAWAAHLEHKGGCDACRDHRTPQCTDGVLIRREYQRHRGLRDGRSYALQPLGSVSPVPELVRDSA